MKLVLAAAAFAAVIVAAAAFAGPIEDLEQGKDFWFLMIDKTGAAIGYQHDVYAKDTWDGKPALKLTRTAMDKVYSSWSMEVIRDHHNPLYSLTLKTNASTIGAKATVAGWEYTKDGKTQPLQPGHIDYFSYDDQGIGERVNQTPVGQAKHLRVWDVRDGTAHDWTVTNKGPKETSYDGKKIPAFEYEVMDAGGKTIVHVMKDTWVPIDIRNPHGDSIKRVSKEEVQKAFPNAK
jgi:hypothetical protein